MNRLQAATLLGVDINATPSEARKAFLTRARLLHPDRLGSDASAEEVKAANDAMSQLNTANQIMQSPPSATKEKQQSSNKDSEEDYGFPVFTDSDRVCDMCGWGPATNVKFNSVTGLIIFWRWFTFEAKLCRFCGIAMYNENQRNTLVKGWWGILSFFATIFAFFSNLSQSRQIHKLSQPQGRYPGAYSLSPVPLAFSTPWWKRPSALLSSAIALGIVTFFLVGILDEASRTGTASTSPTSTSQTDSNTPNGGDRPQNLTGYVGTCWTETGIQSLEVVSCSDTRADWIVAFEERARSTIPGETNCSSDSYMPLNWEGDEPAIWDLCLNSLW